jgi:hypothetical protein
MKLYFAAAFSTPGRVEGRGRRRRPYSLRFPPRGGQVGENKAQGDDDEDQGEGNQGDVPERRLQREFLDEPRNGAMAFVPIAISPPLPTVTRPVVWRTGSRANAASLASLSALERSSRAPT